MNKKRKKGIRLSFRKKDKKKKDIEKVRRNRVKGIAYILAGTTLFIVVKLTYIMTFKNEAYGKMATEQWKNEITLKAKRGKILDRNGSELAVSGEVYRVDLDLKTLNETIEANIKKSIKIAEGIVDKEAIRKDERDKVINNLAKILGEKPEAIEKKIGNKNSGGVELARQIDKSKADGIKALEVKGIIVSDDTKRYYPNGSFLSHTLGTIDSSGKGLIGLELQYNNILSGVSGVKIAEHSPFDNELQTDPIEGKDLVLTIDEKIQYIAEREAKATLKEENSESVNILVMDPTNGEILAMASEKSFDPNNPREDYEDFKGKNPSEKIQQMWRNRIISNIYEPGSTFKVITAAAALEEGVAGNGETYYCPGYKMVDGRRINCWKGEGHGTQTFDQILNNSCNPGFIDIGMKLGKEKLHKYIEAFGFGEQTGIDLPGESKGIIKKLDEMSLVDLATISFGQTNAVTMIQLLTAFNATVNGGKLIEPHIMREVTHLDNSGVRVIDEKIAPKSENVISEETSKKIREMLQKVVDNGTGKRAFIEGYNVGGKTGTAQTVNADTGAYGANKIASFIAEAPSDNPKVTVLVTIDSPKASSDSGGIVAAPVAKKVLESIFGHEDPETFNFNTKSTKSAIVPEVRNLEVGESEKILKESGFEFEKVGEGKFVNSINPIPGSVIGTGEKVKIELSNKPARDKEVVVPNFVGFSKEMAESLAKKIGLTVSFNGEGDIINAQSLKVGKKVKATTKINFALQG